MSDPRIIIALATLLAALGVWLLLPHGSARGRTGGALMGLAALALSATQLPGLGGWIADGAFYVLAAVTVIAAVGAIVSINPVYCAIWFGLALVGVAGLYLLAGAQFLAVATIVVYAGAILVTFLFVLMLAQPQGYAAYDQLSWEPMLAAATGALMVGVLTITVADVFGQQGTRILAAQAAGQAEPAKGDAAAAPPTSGDLSRAMQLPQPESLRNNVLSPQHVAHFGAELFGRHLLAVEATGVLLLAALVGAAAIIAQASGSRGRRRADGAPPDLRR